MIPPELLEILRCPATGQTLRLADAGLLAEINAGHKNGETLAAALVTADNRRIYPIRDGIPVLLMDEARSF